MMKNKDTLEWRNAQKVLVIYKKSQFDLLENSPDAHNREVLDADAKVRERLLQSHKVQQDALTQVRKTLEELEKETEFVYRADITPEHIQNAQLIITVGGDGTVLDTARYITNKPLIGINSDPATSCGAWCAADAYALKDIFANQQDYNIQYAPRMKVAIDGRVLPELGMNNVRVRHPSDGTMRYTLTIDDVVLPGNKDSGLLVATGRGATGWITKAGGIPPNKYDQRLQVATQETDTNVGGFGSNIKIESKIREALVVIDTEYITHKVQLGETVTIGYGAPLPIVLRTYARKN